MYKFFFDSNWGRFIHDENGNLAWSLYSNNTKSFYNYDDAGRLDNLKVFKGNSGNLGDYSYNYDPNSNITDIAFTSDSLGSHAISYTYDALNRLTSETLRDGTQIEYTYDAVGNRLTKKVTQGLLPHPSLFELLLRGHMIEAQILFAVCL